MTSDELNARTARFYSWQEAQYAADRAMPRRTNVRRRPYAQPSGYHSVRAGRNVWIVMIGNVVMLDDGTMYDYQRKAYVRG